MELSLIFDIITAVAVTLGIIFGLLQLRHYHLSQERDAALLLLNSFQSDALFNGIWMIQELPPGLSKAELEDRLGEDIKSVYLAMSIWDSIGPLVFKHELSIDMVADIYGGPIIISWQKLEKYVAEVRVDLKRETSFEWFQWLAERLIARESVKPSIPAYRAHRDWK